MKKYMFTAKWCGNCQIMKPIVESMDIEIIDVEENPSLAKKYSIMSLPTFVKDSDGVIEQKFGAMPKQLLEEFFKYNE